MALMEWTDALSVNVKEIDEQHKVLVKYLNELHDAMSVGKGRDALKGILDGLVNYTVSHFSTEEKYMKKFDYPDYTAHKVEHVKLTEQVLEAQKNFTEGKTITLTMKTMNFLKDWLTNHIMIVDKKYSAFFNSKGLK